MQVQAGFEGQRVLVMGLGSFGGGVGAVRFLLQQGAHVVVTDLRSKTELAKAISQLEEYCDNPKLSWRLGEHSKDDFREADLIVVNPAVRRDNPYLGIAEDAGVPLTSEMNLFWQHNRGKVVGVTGSNGKSTTAALIHSILHEAGESSWLGGNIGKSLLPEVDQIESHDWVVLELSSFQLADLNRIQASPNIAVVTNFAPNHLDWHDSIEAYESAKQTILRWQGKDHFAILNDDDPVVSNWSTNCQRLSFGTTDAGNAGVFQSGDRALIRFDGRTEQIPLAESLKLPGPHNFSNALAATCAALAVGIPTRKIGPGISKMSGLPHRMECVGEWQGRHFYNDSLATTPESAIQALQSFDEPIVLIAGGYDKQVDLAEFGRAIAQRTKSVALIGQTADTLREVVSKLQPSVEIGSGFPNLAGALEWAVAQTEPGDVVLLSPGCASYGWFRNFAERGDAFSELVRERLSSTA